MSSFARTLAIKVEDYVTLRRSLGYAFQKQAATLRALVQYAKVEQLDGPLTRDMALNFVFSWEGTANGRAIRHGVVRRFCEYLARYTTHGRRHSIRAHYPEVVLFRRHAY